MADNSKISWCNATWSPVRVQTKEDRQVHILTDKERTLPAGTWGYHCERISPGCKNCYAERMNGRCLPAWGTGLDYTVPNRAKVEVYLDEAELMKPLHWRKPRRIFVESMSDLYGEWVPDEMIDRVKAVEALCRQHTFLELTKRADRLERYVSAKQHGRVCEIACEIPGGIHGNAPYPFPNVHLGVSCEDQQRADERIPHLLRTPAAVRWVSVEPMLGPVDLRRYLTCQFIGGSMDHYPEICDRCGRHYEVHQHPGCDQVICGGESGPGARPCDLAWVRSLRDQCTEAGTAFYCKQLGANVTQPAEKGLRFRFTGAGLRWGNGSDPAQWPADLRIQQFPEVRRG